MKFFYVIFYSQKFLRKKEDEKEKKRNVLDLTSSPDKFEAF